MTHNVMKRTGLLLLIPVMLAGAAHAKEIVVAPAGGGDVQSIKEAIAAIPDNSAERTIVRIKPGTYDEGQLILPKQKINVTWIGEDAATTIISHARNVKQPPPDGSVEKVKGTGVIIEASDFRAENLTFQNIAGDDGQAMALRVEGDRAVFIACRLLGWQDTLRANSKRQYYKNCYIEGRVDFIYGGATAVFDQCHIHSKNGGYITAASTPQENEFGFVFIRCKVTGDDKPWIAPPTSAAATRPSAPGKLTYLGRPWRPYGQVAFIECDLGEHIRPEGWHNWGKEENEKTARYAEHRNTGPGAATDQRVAWSRQLTDDEAKRFTVENVLKGADGWKPDVVP